MQQASLPTDVEADVRPTKQLVDDPTGARHMVRYVFRKGSQLISLRYLRVRPPSRHYFHVASVAIGSY